MSTYEYCRLGLIIGFGFGIPLLAGIIQYVRMNAMLRSLEHNLPELWKERDALAARVSALEKRLSVERILTEGPTHLGAAGGWRERPASAAAPRPAGGTRRDA